MDIRFNASTFVTKTVDGTVGLFVIDVGVVVNGRVDLMLHWYGGVTTEMGGWRAVRWDGQRKVAEHRLTQPDVVAMLEDFRRRLRAEMAARHADRPAGDYPLTYAREEVPLPLYDKLAETYDVTAA